MCLFEGALIVIQFWMLVHTTDWQHIVTLVLLMFANYLLLAKLFKDKVSLANKERKESNEEEKLKAIVEPRHSGYPWTDL